MTTKGWVRAEIQQYCVIEVQQNSTSLNTLPQSEWLRGEVQSPFKTTDVLWNFDKTLHATKNFMMMTP